LGFRKSRFLKATVQLKISRLKRVDKEEKSESVSVGGEGKWHHQK